MNHTPEARFQAFTCRFLDRVVIPPMWFTSIEHAASDMRNMGRRASLQARGVVFGCPDLTVMQPGAQCWLELKRGKNQATEAQKATHKAMQLAGQSVFVVRTMSEVLAALRLSGFRLHDNAENLAVEYEARASVEKAPTRNTRKRVVKPTARAIQKAHAAGVWNP